MKLAKHLPSLLTGVFALALGAASQTVYWNAVSARSAGQGGTFSPASDGVLDSLSSNPAGLTYLQHPVVTAAGLAGFSRGDFSNTANRDAPLAASPSAVPFGAYGAPVHHSRFAFGVGFVPLLSAKSDWTYVDAPGTAGASYGLQRNRSEILVARASAGLGISLNRHVSAGLTLGADYNTNLLQGVYVFQREPALKGLKTLLDLRTTGFGVNGGAGLLVQASSRLNLGLAWKSKSEIDSHGTASGNLGAQLAAAGLHAQPDFAYRAAVHNTVPQSILLSANVRASNRWKIAAQCEWIGWRQAFHALPIALTNGKNADVNSLLGSTSLRDTVPLDWKNQFPVRIGLQRAVTETLAVRAGFAHTNGAVPNSTAMPLTAAIFQDQLTSGAGWHKGRAVVEGAYGFVPRHTSNVGSSLLQAGEYSGSRIRAGLQLVTVSTTLVF